MSGRTNAKRILLATFLAGSVGCSSPGSIASMNPFAGGAPDASPGVSASLSDQESVAGSEAQGDWLSPIKKAADGARGQVGSVSLAMKSAYGKAKSAVTGVFVSDDDELGTPRDVLSLSHETPTLGPEVYVASGQMWETNGDHEKAMEQYARALETEPDNAAALASVARLYNRQGKLDQAIEYFEKAISSEPSDPGLYSELGMVLSQMGRHEEAADQLQKAIAIAPKTKRYANNLAVVLMEAGRTEEVFAVLTKAHEPAKAHYNMAYLHYQHQHLDKTQSHLEQALAIDPSLQPARDLLARLGSSSVAQTAKKTYDAANVVAQNATLQAVLQAVSGSEAEAGVQEQAGGEVKGGGEAVAASSEPAEAKTDSSVAVSLDAPEPEVRVAERPAAESDAKAATTSSSPAPAAAKGPAELQVPPSLLMQPPQ